MTFHPLDVVVLQVDHPAQGLKRGDLGAYGSPALTVHGKMFACLAVHRSAEPNTLAVCIDFGQRNALISEDPKTYYLTDPYVNYPYVLVRLAHIRQDALRDLLLTGRRFASTAKKLEVRRRRRK